MATRTVHICPNFFYNFELGNLPDVSPFISVSMSAPLPLPRAPNAKLRRSRKGEEGKGAQFRFLS